jgi:hypothetical protein
MEFKGLFSQKDSIYIQPKCRLMSFSTGINWMEVSEGVRAIIAAESDRTTTCYLLLLNYYEP